MQLKIIFKSFFWLDIGNVNVVNSQLKSNFFLSKTIFYFLFIFDFFLVSKNNFFLNIFHLLRAKVRVCAIRNVRLDV